MKNNNIYVLHCAEQVKGGVATYLNQLCSMQAQNINFGQIHILVPESQKKYISSENNIFIHSFPESTFTRLFSSIYLGIYTYKLLKKINFNIVHLHSSFAGFIIRPLLFIFPFKNLGVVYCPHGWAWDRRQSIVSKKIIIAIEYLLQFMTDRIICISKHEYDSAKELLFRESNLNLIYSGIALDIDQSEVISDFSYWPNGVKRLLFVGRTDFQKGIDVLLSAIEGLGSNFYLKIAGGPALDRTFELPSSLVNVELLGWLSPEDLKGLYTSADILVIPSRWEGFGLVALEAMKFSLPIVASSVGGLSEIIQDGITGILVPPDSSTALASGIVEISRKDLKRMGDAGRERALALFEISRLNQEIFRVYKAVLEDR